MEPLAKLNQVYEEHRAICEAIAEGHAVLAHDLMRQHLEGSRNRLFEDKTLDLSRR